MAQAGNRDYRRTAIACPLHGSTHLQALITPDPSDYFAAYYCCGQCVGREIDKWNSQKHEVDHHGK